MPQLTPELDEGLGDWKLISLNLFRIIFFIGLGLLPVTVFSYFMADGTFISFLVTNIVFLGFGFSLLIDEDEELEQKHALIVAALAWLFIPFISMLPFEAYGHSLITSYFEAMSGWTSTGLTFIESFHTMPPSLLLFRSFTQWVGGLGVIVFALIIMRRAYTPELFRSERETSFMTSVTQTVRRTWMIYTLLTALGAIALIGTGVSPFVSLNLAMTGLATGGFISLSSIAQYGLATKLVIVLLMLAGATSIPLLYWVFQGRFRPLVGNAEFRMMLLLSFLGSLLIVGLGGKTVIDALFHAVSALTGTGFSIASLSEWGTIPVFSLTILMIIGGCSGSTTSALKIWRVLVLIKSVLTSIKRVFLPDFAVLTPKIGGRAVEDEEIIEVSNYVFLYLFLALILTFVLLVEGVPLADALFVTFSTQGNVGLNSFGGWFGLGEITKVLMIVSMWLGRLQIFPALILVTQLLRVKRLEI